MILAVEMNILFPKNVQGDRRVGLLISVFATHRSETRAQLFFHVPDGTLAIVRVAETDEGGVISANWILNLILPIPSRPKRSQRTNAQDVDQEKGRKGGQPKATLRILATDDQDDRGG